MSCLYAKYAKYSQICKMKTICRKICKTMQNEICKNMHTYALQNMHLYASLCINIQEYLNMQIISIHMQIPKVGTPVAGTPVLLQQPITSISMDENNPQSLHLDTNSPPTPRRDHRR